MFVSRDLCYMLAGSRMRELFGTSRKRISVAWNINEQTVITNCIYMNANVDLANRSVIVSQIARGPTVRHNTCILFVIVFLNGL